MHWRANGLAASVAAACLIATAPAMAGTPTRIDTVAGGGVGAIPELTSGLFFPEPQSPPLATSVALPSPAFVAAARPMYWWDPGNPLPFFVLRDDSKCAIDSTTGNDPIGGSSGPTDSGRIWTTVGGVQGGCVSSAGGYSARDAWLTGLDHPRSIAVWGTELNGEDTDYIALIANSGTGRVERTNWDLGNTDYDRNQFVITTVAGSDRADNCGDSSTVSAPPDGATPNAARFCTIESVATPPDSTPGGPYVIIESHRENNFYGDHIYRVEDNLVHHLSYDLGGNFGAYTRDGKLLLANEYSDGVEKVDLSNGDRDWIAANPLLQPPFGDQGPGFKGDGGEAQSAAMATPTAVAATYDGGYVIATPDDCRVRYVDDTTATGTITTIAGTDCTPGPLGDGGTPTAAFLDHPRGVAMSPGGVLIADTGNNRIRLINRTAVISAPNPATVTASPTFDFASTDSPPHFKCSIDGGSEFNCPAPFTLPALVNGAPVSDGQHTLAVWENGVPGSSPPYPPDPTPATAGFKLDRTGPATFALREPAADATGLAPSPSFSWDSTTDALAGLGHYELWIDGTKDSDVAPTACSGGMCAATPKGALSEAGHNWQIRAVDTVGNVRRSESRAFVTGNPPKAAFTAAPNPALVGRPVTFDAQTSSDESGIARYEWDLDGDGGFETDTGATPTTTRTYVAPTTVPVHLRVTDGVGKTSEASTALKVNTTPEAQSLLGISINSGAQYTNSPNVKLLVKAPATASSILVSNDGGFLAPATLPVAASIDWKLDSSGPERLPKTVYSRFMLGPIISETYADDIILDEIPPVVQSAALGKSAAATAAKARKYVVKVKAKDSNSGVGSVQVAVNKKKPGKLLAYKPKLAVKSSGKPKFVRARDKAGNFSAWKKLR